MAKKYVAKIDNIFFNGKRYNTGDIVMVDNNVEMNPYRWLTFEEYEKQQEKIARSTTGLTDAESKARVKELGAMLTKAQDELKIATDEKNMANAALKDAKAQVEALEKALAESQAKIKSLESELKKAK